MTRAVLIAGGTGERLKPTTYETPKPLLTVGGRSLIDNNIDLFWKHKAYEIWLSLGHQAPKIREEFPTIPFWVDSDLETGNIKPLGTGTWLNRLSHSKDSKLFDDDFFVCNVDNLFNVNLDEVRKVHEENDFLVTIACTKVDDLREYGSVSFSDDKITRFLEKRKLKNKKAGWINSGYYLFNPKLFDYVKEMGVDLNKPFSLEKDLFPKLAKEGLLGGVKCDGQWFDIGTPDRWEKAIRDWEGVF